MLPFYIMVIRKCFEISTSGKLLLNQVFAYRCLFREQLRQQWCVFHHSWEEGCDSALFSKSCWGHPRFRTCEVLSPVLPCWESLVHPLETSSWGIPNESGALHVPVHVFTARAVPGGWLTLGQHSLLAVILFLPTWRTGTESPFK